MLVARRTVMVGRTLVVAAGLGSMLIFAREARADDEPNVIVEPATPAPAPAAPAAPAPTPTPAAPARDPKAFKPGLEMAFHLGPSFVMGNADKGQPLSEQVGVPVAFEFDVGHRFNEQLYLGGLWAMGFGTKDPRPCPAGFDCDAPGLISEIGIGLRYHPVVPAKTFDPWVGGGLALAIEGYSGDRTVPRGDLFCAFDCTSSKITARTLRFGAAMFLEGGVDYRISRKVGVGLSLSTFIGKYLTWDTTIRDKNNNELGGGAGGSPDGGYHIWILPTARVVINP